MYAIGWFIAIAIEMIIAIIMKDFIWIGVMVITIGGMFLACLLHGDVKIKNMLIFMICYCFLWGVLIIGSSVADRIAGVMVDLDAYVFVLGLGLVLIICGIYMGIIKKLQCSQKVSAAYRGAQSYTVNGHTTYTPAFAFDFEGKHYSNTSGETFSGRKIQRKFQEGKQYDIYVDPRNPNSFCVSRSIEKSCVLLIVLGILFMCVPIWAMLG